MRKSFDEKLDALKHDVIDMLRLSETFTEQTIERLHMQSDDANDEIKQFNSDIHALEREVEKNCLELLRLQQPVASDLRVISAALKFITDIGRIGQQLEEINLILDQSSFDIRSKMPNIIEIGKLTQEMVSSCLTAYLTRDQLLAEHIVKFDDQVDTCYSEITRAIIKLIKQEDSSAKYALEYHMVAKYFEKIADHCSNIAKWIIYLETAQHLA